MSLFPDEDILTKEIESWIGFADRRRQESILKNAKGLSKICRSNKC
jgi:hypothetical protein